VVDGAARLAALLLNLLGCSQLTTREITLKPTSLDNLHTETGPQMGATRAECRALIDDVHRLGRVVGHASILT
jgi:hypothetical protein